MKTLAFFGIKGGTGKTTIAYHLAWMLAERGLRVMMVDLDPQANLTAWSLGEDRVQALWCRDEPSTLSSALRPVMEGRRAEPKALVGQPVSDRIILLPGDLNLFHYDDLLSQAWHRCIWERQDLPAFLQMNALHDVIRPHAGAFGADIVLIDMGPNLGGLNRAALITTVDGIIFPLTPDRLSAVSLDIMGPTLGHWHHAWMGIRNNFPDPPPILNPGFGGMPTTSYVLSRISNVVAKPTSLDGQSADAVAAAYARHVTFRDPPPPGSADPGCLGEIKNYRSLAAIAYDAHKPMFLLRPADGAIGGHQRASQDAYHAFDKLAESVAGRIGLALSTS